MAAAPSAAEHRPSLEQLLAAKEIVIFCGSGGVGKTTTAAAARGHGRRPTSAARCSCSPSTRPGGSPTRSGSRSSATSRPGCPPELFTAAGVEPRGELWAAMLDTKESWDDLVRRHAPDAETRDAILANPLYQQHHRRSSCRATTTSRWSGSTRSTRSGRYDLIVVDTPPTRNAIDFLEAPERMADFFGSRLLRWLIAPYRSRAGQRGLEALLPDRRSHPRHAVPARTSPSSSSSSRRCTTASSSGPRPSSRPSPTGAPRSWS